MQSHGPKRFYTPHSLEFWFQKLGDDWSEAFTNNQLEEGRRIYRAGEVRELELTDRDAIVHRRIDKKDEYAVIEWDLNGLSVRSSTTDRELAHALAVAGLHEIEELVADEISPLPDPSLQNGGGSAQAPAVAPAPVRGGPPSVPRSGALADRAAPAPPAGGVSSSAARVGGASRPLFLVFKTRVVGLAFQA